MRQRAPPNVFFSFREALGIVVVMWIVASALAIHVNCLEDKSAHLLEPSEMIDLEKIRAEKARELEAERAKRAERDEKRVDAEIEAIVADALKSASDEARSAWNEYRNARRDFRFHQRCRAEGALKRGEIETAQKKIDDAQRVIDEQRMILDADKRADLLAKRFTKAQSRLADAIVTLTDVADSEGIDVSGLVPETVESV